MIRTLSILALLSAGAAATVPSISVSGAWSRPAVETGAVYATVRNASGKSDALIGAGTSIARYSELHESVSHSGMMNMAGGMVSMQRVASIPIPAHGRVVLQPGGYHIMLIGLKRNLTPGQTFSLRLHFLRAGWITVRVAVHSMV